ncbi:MAG: hypothetical protein LBN27_06470 [Prevotellaceae bacterium]|nr:hypothetical protein [Prevotellaceae bacterium]
MKTVRVASGVIFLLSGESAELNSVSHLNEFVILTKVRIPLPKWGLRVILRLRSVTKPAMTDRTNG